MALRRTRSLPRGLLAVLCMMGCGSETAAPPPEGIFLIVVDTLRADRLSSYSDAAPPTPRIDALVDRGTSFRRAQAAASWTLPSMASVLTSRLPRELGMLERSDDPKWPTRQRQRRRLESMPLQRNAQTLADVFDAAGFETGAFVNQPMLAPRRGFDRGFGTWVQASGEGRLVRREALNPRSRQRWASTIHAWENDVLLVGAFEDWVEANAGGPPLFGWLHLLTPHRPYLPPAAHAPGEPEPDMAVLYAAEIRAVDELIGRAVAAIDRHIDPERSVVVFTSDHGEAFGEHGEFEHGNTLHAEVLHVPLVVSAAGRLPRGRAVDAVVRTLDIAPTLLELAGLEAPSAMRGQSLLPLAQTNGPDREVLAEGILYGASEQVLIADGFKLHVDDARPTPALFSIRDDPEERNDLAAQEPERVSALRARLDAIRAGTRPVADEGPESDETLEALRALGYVEDATPPVARPVN